LQARVFGLSTQSPAEQLEACQRLHLPYPLLSDNDLALTRAWQLPTFAVDGRTLIRRITIFLVNGIVDGVLYPVFPPDRSAESALAWLREHDMGDLAREQAAQRLPPIPQRRGMPHPIPKPPVR
jgi:peroxiredoxin